MHTDPTVRCDHTMTAILVRATSGHLMLTATPHAPYGHAPPTTHIGDHTNPDLPPDQAYPTAAGRRVWCDLGLLVPGEVRQVIDRWSDNRCTRPLDPDRPKPGHYWRVYQSTSPVDTEVLMRTPRATHDGRPVTWASRDLLNELAHRTVEYVAGRRLPHEWAAAPGLDPVWVWWLHLLHVLPGIADPDAYACLLWAERDRT